MKKQWKATGRLPTPLGWRFFSYEQTPKRARERLFALQDDHVSCTIGGARTPTTCALTALLLLNTEH